MFIWGSAEKFIDWPRYSHGMLKIYKVMVTVIGNRHVDTSSNPRWGWLHFT